MAKIEKIIKASSHILLGLGANVVVVQRAEWSLLTPDLQFISSLGLLNCNVLSPYCAEKT